MKTVKDFFENIEDKEELIFLGGGVVALYFAGLQKNGHNTLNNY